MIATLHVAGVSIPKLGLGTYALYDKNCERAVEVALRAGYRHLDTAEMYQNEAAVGRGLCASGVERDEVFVTTKVWHDHLEGALLRAAIEASLARLKLDFVDLYLIHWPNPEVPLPQTIEALNEVRERGLTRSIGVCNFPSGLLQEAARLSDAPLAVNQVEYHPYIDQRPVLQTVRALGMGLTAYCPIARGRVADDPVIAEIAEAHGVSPAVVALAWLVGQDGVIAIPKSGTPARIEANFAALSLELSAAERAAIDGLRRPDGRMIHPAFAPRWDVAA